MSIPIRDRYLLGSNIHINILPGIIRRRNRAVESMKCYNQPSPSLAPTPRRAHTMSALASSFRPLSASLDTWGENVITSFFNPALAGKWASRPQSGWPLADFSTALYVALGYVVLVAVGFLVKNSAAPEKALAKKPAAEGKPARVSVGEKFAKEPVLILQTIYNFVQVALCGYMMVESIRIAYKEGISPFCQPFDAQKPTFTLVLWLFYASKVRPCETCARAPRCPLSPPPPPLPLPPTRSHQTRRTLRPSGARLLRHLLHHRPRQVEPIHLSPLLPPLLHIPSVLARLECGQ